jgi:hypothetical protein
VLALRSATSKTIIVFRSRGGSHALANRRRDVRRRPDEQREASGDRD